MFHHHGVKQEQDELDQEFNRIQEEQHNEALYKRELLARMFGG
jgi:hypothetical protein